MKTLESDSVPSDNFAAQFDEPESGSADGESGSIIDQPLPSERKRLPLLSQAEVNALAARIADGDQAAKNKLVLHNMGLAHMVAHSYRWSGSFSHFDLVQEGVFGLMIAAEKYNPALGNTFSTYALHWVRNTISQALVDKGHLIRVPTVTASLATKVQRAMDRLAEQGTSPTVPRVAALIGVKPTRLKLAMAALTVRYPWSLDATVPSGQNEDGQALIDYVVDTSHSRPETVLEARDELLETINRIRDLLRWIRNRFSDRDYRIFTGYYGLDAARQEKTLEELACRYSVTRQRVQQIIRTVWQKSWKSHISQEALQYFLDEGAQLEELAAMEVDWQELVSSIPVLPRPDPAARKEAPCALLIERMQMLRVTAKERLRPSDYLVFNEHYGLEVGGEQQAFAVTAAKFRMSIGGVRMSINRSWRHLLPYARHFNRQKTRVWLAERSRIRKTSG